MFTILRLNTLSSSARLRSQSNTDQMAAKYDSVKCRSCARVLAVVSAIGLTPTTSPDTSPAGCSTCQQFNSLYDAIQAANTDWAVLQNKRDSITKSFARENHMRAHMEFDNWLMTVEAPRSPRDGLDEQPKGKDPKDGNNSSEDEEQMSATKRRRSHSPTTQRPGDKSDLPPHEQQGISLSLRTSPKRSRSAAALAGRKRLKFSDSVQFHDDYRSSEQFHRPSETYVRGRNAPPEGSEYMDTSGSGLTFLKFTGMKKVGAKWVELSKEELAKQSEKAISWAELRKLATADKSITQPEDGDAVGELGRNEGAPTDARAARLARRAKGTSSAEPAMTRGLKSRRSRETSRKGKQLQPNGTPNGVEEAADGPTFALSTTTAHGDHHHSDGNLGQVENVGDDGLERRSDAVPETVAMCADQVQEAAKPNDEPHMETQVTSEAKCQGHAAQPSMSSVEPQATVLSRHGSSHTGPTDSISCKAHNAPEIGTQELLPNWLSLQPTLTILRDSKTASTTSTSKPSGARRDACDAPVQKRDFLRNDTILAAQTKLMPLEEALAIETPMRELSAEQEHSVKNLDRFSSPSNEPQVQGHSNAAIASVTIPQDPDRHPVAKTSTGETHILAGGVIDEAEEAVGQSHA
ncbi:hypothetical protein G6011_06680 [Alternaria panax]|uniref:Stc1 domain-containing protein n=1 Tax=Alternaria panax TaxID=48097 RepID=A0AAD4FHA6_9PLEO|nr:hypothetical protein G6011_06680 [Alternaria panax]